MRNFLLEIRATPSQAVAPRPCDSLRDPQRLDQFRYAPLKENYIKFGLSPLFMKASSEMDTLL